MLSCRRGWPSVSASAACMRARIAPSKRLRSPMKRRRAPRRCSSSTSRSSAPRNSFIRPPTSSVGRFQFSLENANRVIAPTPRSRQNSTQRLTARAPARWPMIRGRWRCCAQRPLPSMMMARCCGIGPVPLAEFMRVGRRERRPGKQERYAAAGADTQYVTAAGNRDDAAWPSAAGRSDGHQFLFLALDHLVDVLDRAVGDLLDIGLGAARLVLGDLLFLQQSLDLGVGIAADVADRNLRVLALAVHDLGEVAAAFFGQ